MHDRRTDAKAQFEVLVACDLAGVMNASTCLSIRCIKPVAPTVAAAAALAVRLEAALLVAGLAVESPEHVRRTYEPVLVRGIKLERLPYTSAVIPTNDTL